MLCRKGIGKRYTTAAIDTPRKGYLMCPSAPLPHNWIGRRRHHYHIIGSGVVNVKIPLHIVGLGIGHWKTNKEVREVTSNGGCCFACWWKNIV